MVLIFTPWCLVVDALVESGEKSFSAFFHAERNRSCHTVVRENELHYTLKGLSFFVIQSKCELFYSHLPAFQLESTQTFLS